jgi:uncharacterized membrane protein HdeD (DUF308 family)
MIRDLLTRQSHRLILDGLLAVAVGVLILAFPGATALTAVGLVAVWSTVNGVNDLASGIATARTGGRAWPLVITGLLSVTAAIVVLSAPVATLLGIATIVGFWQVAVGATGLVAAIRHDTPGRGLQAATAAFRMVAGGLFVAMPAVGLQVTFSLIAFNALVLGTVLVAAGLAVRSGVADLAERVAAIGGGTVEPEARSTAA